MSPTTVRNHLAIAYDRRQSRSEGSFSLQIEFDCLLILTPVLAAMKTPQASKPSQASGSSKSSEYGSITVHTPPPVGHQIVAQQERRMSWKAAMPLTVSILVVLFMVSTVQESRERSLEKRAMESTISADDSSSSNSQHTKEFFYDDQLVDHHDTEKHKTFTQRYYQKGDSFGGAGSPIFIIFGGEDPLENLLYPFIYDHLAQKFNAHTFALEHRFFGKSMPVKNATHAQLHQLLTPDQTLRDVARFIQHKRHELGCSLQRSSRRYCPAITVGGSYPGFLSGLMRFAHPDVVDISYASSAPFDLYDHNVAPNAYYEKVTSTADEMTPGCADAVRGALLDAQTDIVNSDNRDLLRVAGTYGICPGMVPKYIQTTNVLSQELMIIVATHFAEYNMGAYPPSPELDFVKACKLFLDPEMESPAAKVAAFLAMADEEADCFDMMTELPPGPNGTISASDWSGVGSGPEGYYWEYLSCLWAPGCGMSASSMFPPRPWSLKWETQHCESRFEVRPDIHGLNRQFHFDDRSKVQHLLLTNGIVDGWSTSSVLVESVDAPGVRVVNMVNGAHHSDLSHVGPTPNDTPDVKTAYIEIANILEEWLNELKAESADQS